MYLGSWRFGSNFVGEGKAWGSLFALDYMAVRFYFLTSGAGEKDLVSRWLSEVEGEVERTINNMTSSFDPMDFVPILKLALAVRLHTWSLINRCASRKYRPSRSLDFSEFWRASV